MADNELWELRRKKAKLLKEACELRDRLKEQEENAYQYSSTLNFKLLSTDENITNSDTKLTDKYENALCEASRYVTGITFQDVDRKWLHNSVYVYTANVTAKALHFGLELKVDLKDEHDFEILDITCQFVGIDRCYMLEISPWVLDMTKMKNFSFLMSATSDYSDQDLIRSKILRQLEVEKYGSMQQCNENNGGILVDIHSPKDTSQVYLKFEWCILFSKAKWHIEHCFTINPVGKGVEFAEDNHDLLNNFCKTGLKKDYLKDLWSKLCSAVDQYESNDKQD